MGQRLTLPLLFLAVLLAGGAFFWMSGGTRGTSPAPTSQAAPRAPEATPGELLPAASVPDESPAAPTARVAVPESQPEPDAGRTKKERGGIHVRGTVVDRFGAPVPGARVTLAKDTGFPLDLEVGRDFTWLQRQRTECDAAGQFEFEGVQPGGVQIGVRAAGFAPFERRGLSVAASDTQLDPIALARGAILTGIVVDPTGRGVPEARIVRSEIDSSAVFFSGAREPTAVTASDGRFRIDELACGAWRFVVRSDDHPDLVVDGLAEEPGVEVSGLRWQLEPGATIAGTVVDVPGAERGQLEVRALPAGSGQGLLGFGSSRVAKVESNGAFVVRGARVGESYSLQARHARTEEDLSFWERSRSNSVSARAGESGVLLRYQPEAALTFTVYDGGTRLPLERFKVESGIEWTSPLTDDDGHPREVFPGGVVRVGGLRPGSESERIQLKVEATGYRSYERADIAVRAGQELDLGAIYLEPVPLVRVHVTDAKGQPVADATVRMQKDTGDSFEVRHSISISEDEGVDSFEFGEGRSARTDREGWAELSSFEGETVSLSARAQGFSPRKVEGVFLPRGESHEQEIVLTPGGTVAVQVLDAHGAPLPAARVEHRAAAAGGASNVLILGGGGGPGEVTDAEGRVVFENLEAGQHSFRLGRGSGGMAFTSDSSFVVHGLGGDEGADWSQVQVVEGERAELTLRAAPEATLRGRVREAGKVLAGATLKLQKESAGGERRGLALPGMGGGPQAKSDGEGRYLLEGVDEGRYTLTVEHPTRRMPSDFPVQLREGENTFDVDLSLSIVSGRITDAKGQGIAGVQVWAERSEPQGGQRFAMRMIMVTDDGDGASVGTGTDFGERVRTDADGRYTLRGVTSDVDLVVKAEGDTVQPGESSPLRVLADEVKEHVDFALEPAGSMRVEATLGDGAPARFQLVQATYKGDDGASVAPKVGFIQSGSTLLKGLRPGLWRVSVRNASGGPGGGGPEQDVEVVSGEEASASFQVD